MVTCLVVVVFLCGVWLGFCVCVLFCFILFYPKQVKEFGNSDLETLSLMLNFNCACNPSEYSTTQMFKFKHIHSCQQNWALI